MQQIFKIIFHPPLSKMIYYELIHIRKTIRLFRRSICYLMNIYNIYQNILKNPLLVFTEDQGFPNLFIQVFFHH